MFSFTQLKNAFEYFLARSASDQPRGCVGPELGETEQTVTDTITVCKLPSLCGGHPLEKQSKASGKASLGICFHWNRSCFTPSHNQQKKCRTWSRATIQLRKKMGGKTNSTGSQMTDRLHHILGPTRRSWNTQEFWTSNGKSGHSKPKLPSSKNVDTGTSLAVQWWRLHAPNAGGPVSIPSQGMSSHRLQPRVLMLQH